MITIADIRAVKGCRTTRFARAFGVERAANLMRHEVPTELHVFAGAYHGFMSFVPEAAIS